MNKASWVRIMISFLLSFPLSAVQMTPPILTTESYEEDAKDLLKGRAQAKRTSDAIKYYLEIYNKSITLEKKCAGKKLNVRLVFGPLPTDFTPNRALRFIGSISDDRLVIRPVVDQHVDQTQNLIVDYYAKNEDQYHDQAHILNFYKAGPRCGCHLTLIANMEKILGATEDWLQENYDSNLKIQAQAEFELTVYQWGELPRLFDSVKMIE